jgi:hypothetical protein
VDVQHPVNAVSAIGPCLDDGVSFPVPVDRQVVGDVQVAGGVVLFARTGDCQGVVVPTGGQGDRVGAVAGGAAAIRSVGVGCRDGLAQGALGRVGVVFVVFSRDGVFSSQPSLKHGLAGFTDFCHVSRSMS